MANVYIHLFIIGRFGAFRLKGHVLESSYGRQVLDLGQVLLAVASSALALNSATVSMLCRERL